MSALNAVRCTHQDRAHTASLLKWFRFVLNISANKHYLIHTISVSNDRKCSTLFPFLNDDLFNQYLSSKDLKIKSILSTINAVRCTHQDMPHTVSRKLLELFQIVLNTYANNHNFLYMIYVQNDGKFSYLFLFLNGS